MKSIYILLLTITVALGCSTPQVALTDNLWTNKEAYKVKGRQGILIKQKLSFGQYATNTVSRSFTKGNSSFTGIGSGSFTNSTYRNIIGVEYTNKKQTIRFSLKDDQQNNSDVYCVSKFNARDLQIGGRPNSILNIAEDLLGITSQSNSFFYVQVHVDSSRGPWQLILNNQAAQAKAKQYKGIFALDKDTYYTLKPITKLATKKGNQSILAGSVGFEIFNTKDEPVAAVSLMDNGMVFMNSTSAKEKFLLANLIAALLLQQEIE